MIQAIRAAPSWACVSDEELMDGLKNRDETALHEFRVRFGRIIRTIVDETLVEDYSPRLGRRRQSGRSPSLHRAGHHLGVVGTKTYH